MVSANAKDFDESLVLAALKHYLPTQSPLKDFIHHNSLHAFQNLKFYEAIFQASKVFGFQATTPLKDFREMHRRARIDDAVLDRIIVQRHGESALPLWREKTLSQAYNEHVQAEVGQLRGLWKNQYGIDMDNAVQPLLFRVLGHYLDQGIALWEFPDTKLGFLNAIRHLEASSLVSLFKSKRARELLVSEDLSLTALLSILVGKAEYFEQYLFDQQFAHRGWSGLVAVVEASPEVMFDRKEISLADTITLELLLEIDCLDSAMNEEWQSISHFASSMPMDFFKSLPYSELRQVLEIWQDAFEWSYYDQVLSGIEISSKHLPEPSPNNKPSFQALFCIDERECSLRRHVEYFDRKAETFGTPGFFSVEFFFLPQGAKFYEKLCPAPVTPKHLIKESKVTQPRAHDFFYTPKTHLLIPGLIASFVFGLWAIARLAHNLFRPRMSPAIANAFSVMQNGGELSVLNTDLSDREKDLQVGFTVEEMVNRSSAMLKGIALSKNFSPLVYLVGHGSSSANNPHHGAHDCGACSGRPGAVNARVMATMLNYSEVRKGLKKVGVEIPDTTQFLGAMHDTAADEMRFYDESILNAANKKLHAINLNTFERACDMTAKERSRRFVSINTNAPINKIRQAIKARSVSLFEPRPELGHGTNTLCIVGRRALTKNLFLDRRAFMNSYDYRTDLDGKMLTNMMKPLGPVCGGINLEYYFSRVDNAKLGAGTKLPHNVVGLFGVANSSDGDLRPGLPWQMVEVHDPLRLLVVVEHFPEIVLQAIQSTADTYEWFINEWVHLVVIHPETHRLFYFKEGVFVAYSTLNKTLAVIDDIDRLFEESEPMHTNQLPDATQENLPVYFNHH